MSQTVATRANQRFQALGEHAMEPRPDEAPTPESPDRLPKEAEEFKVLNCALEEARSELVAVLEDRRRNNLAVEYLSTRTGLLSRLGVYTSI